MMICMDYHERYLIPDPMIPIASTWLHLVSSITLNSSLHFTPYLLHQPWVIPHS